VRRALAALIAEPWLGGFDMKFAVGREPRKVTVNIPLPMRWRWLNWPAAARRSVTATFFIFINWLLLAPAATFHDVHVWLSYQDKIAHVGIFGALSGLVRWSVPASRGVGRNRVVLILALLTYGAGIEFLQPFMPGSGRSFEWMDLLMDALGVVIGVGLCERLAKKTG